MTDRNVQIVNKVGKHPTLETHPKTASTAYDKNILVNLIAGVWSTVAAEDEVVTAVLQRGAASGDEDYAEAGAKRTAERIQPGDEVEINTNGTLVVGTSYGLLNAYTIDQTNTTQKVFTCTGSISATRARGIFKTLAADGIQ